MDATPEGSRARSVELLRAALTELRIGRELGHLPYDVEQWGRGYRQAVNERRDGRLAQRLYGTPYVERPTPGGELPPPGLVNVSSGADRLYLRSDDVRRDGDNLVYQQWSTVGYHWEVRDESYYGTFFTASVSGSGRVEFHSGIDPKTSSHAYPADPQGWTSLMSAVNEQYRGEPIRRQQMRIWVARS